MILKVNKRNLQRVSNGPLQRVFVYGSLKHLRRDQERCTGSLWLRPAGTAAVDFEDRNGRNGIVWGEIIEVTPHELLQLDYREGAIAPDPWYERILIKTRAGTVAWSYQWARSFEGFQLVPSGVWRWEHLRVWRGRYDRDYSEWYHNALAHPERLTPYLD